MKKLDTESVFTWALWIYKEQCIIRNAHVRMLLSTGKRAVFLHTNEKWLTSLKLGWKYTSNTQLKSIFIYHCLGLDMNILLFFHKQSLNPIFKFTWGLGVKQKPPLCPPGDCTSAHPPCKVHLSHLLPTIKNLRVSQPTSSHSIRTMPPFLEPREEARTNQSKTGV